MIICVGRRAILLFAMVCCSSSRLQVARRPAARGGRRTAASSVRRSFGSWRFMIIDWRLMLKMDLLDLCFFPPFLKRSKAGARHFQKGGVAYYFGANNRFWIWILRFWRHRRRRHCLATPTPSMTAATSTSNLASLTLLSLSASNYNSLHLRS